MCMIHKNVQNDLYKIWLDDVVNSHVLDIYDVLIVSCGTPWVSTNIH